MTLEPTVAESAGAATVLERERQRYAERTPRSGERHLRAVEVLPGGSTRASTFFLPYPATIQRASGIELIDVDGNRYLDFLLNYTTLVAGHAHHAVVSVAIEAAKRGSAVAAPVPGQVELATSLVERIASAERLHFTNSGTEATMAAIRLARAYTSKNVIVKAIGGYHGSYPELEAGIRPGLMPAGVPPTTPVVGVPYNDERALAAAMDDFGDDCAAVILEPVLGSAGVVPARPEYLARAQQLARRHGALFILDEVISFRAARGGAQQLLGLDPDLTALGKVIGGGFPVGAVVGRADVIDQLGDGRVVLSGTFNGNPVTVAAGLATIELLDSTAYGSLDRLGARLADGLSRAISQTGVSAQVTRMASLVNVHFTDHEIFDADSAATSDRVAAAAFHLGLLNRGIFIAPRGLIALSIVTSSEHVDRLIAAAAELFTDLATATGSRSR